MYETNSKKKKKKKAFETPHCLLRNDIVVLWNLESGKRQDLGSWSVQLGEEYRNLLQLMAMVLGCGSHMLAITYHGENKMT